MTGCGAVGSLAMLLWVTPCLPGLDIEIPTDPAYAASWDRVQFSHDLWRQVLQAHVDDEGLVDYAAVADDRRFGEYLYRLAHTDPRRLTSSDARSAYWINAYNAFVIQGVIKTLPVDGSQWAQYSVLNVKVPGVSQPGKGFFVGLKFLAGGQRYSLDEIEKGALLRESGAVGARADWFEAVGPSVPDVRVHMALVCAARGCPPLAREAFEAPALDTQLEARVRAFMRDRARFRLDPRGRTLEVSQLVEWYAGDFSNPAYTPHAGSITEFFAKFVDDEIMAESLRTDPWNVSYLNYDWRLNIQP